MWQRALSRLNSPSPMEWGLPKATLHNLFSVLGTPLVDMFATTENKVTPVCVSPYLDDRAWAVDARPNLCLPTSSNSPQNSPKDQVIPQHHSDTHCFTTPVAPSATSAQPSSSHTADRRSPVPVHPQPSPPPVPKRPSPVGSSLTAFIRDLLQQHHFPDTVMEMAADPLRDSSSHVFNSQWKAFVKWANDKETQSKDLPHIMLAEYLSHHFAENKPVNTIKVHRSSIASVLRMLNLTTTIQEDTIHTIIRRMSILHPRKFFPSAS